jgi:hypothetical protein
MYWRCTARLIVIDETHLLRKLATATYCCYINSSFNEIGLNAKASMTKETRIHNYAYVVNPMFYSIVILTLPHLEPEVPE